MYMGRQLQPVTIHISNIVALANHRKPLTAAQQCFCSSTNLEVQRTIFYEKEINFLKENHTVKPQQQGCYKTQVPIM